jgi:hypothetical protein
VPRGCTISLGLIGCRAPFLIHQRQEGLNHLRIELATGAFLDDLDCSLPT